MYIKFNFQKDKIILSSIFYLILAKLLFSFSFHLQILEFSSYLIDALLIACFGLSILLSRFERKTLYIVFTATFFLTYVGINAIRYGNVPEAIIYYSRFWLPLVLYASLKSVIKNNDEYIIEKSSLMMFVVTFLGVIGVFFMPDNYNHNEVKLPTYFSGLHKSSYIYICNFIIAICLIRYLRKNMQLLAVFSMLIMLYMVFEGWGIRTPILMLFVFTFVVFYNKSNLVLRGGSIFSIVLVVIALFFLGDSIDWNRLSSGRLAMWELKLYMIESRSYIDLLFGTGYGSDYVEVEGWFGEKDSHNNYLQTIVEQGFFGLLLLITSIIVLMLNQGSILGKAAVASYLVSGIVSNGLIYRLVPGYVFIILLVTIEAIYNIERKSNNVL